MLITFKSKASGDLLMFEENARQILDLFGKETHQGIITASETSEAIRVLEAEIARRKIEEAREKEEQEAEERRQQEEEEKGKNDDKDPFEQKPSPKREPPVPFSVRAYPFLQLLQAARKKDRAIVWGV
ncbi:MAG: DUF1840 domain-containing protein [Burkholderiaceae bacterium]|jgi:hypothetical protein|nr:DUF1840 domain-containing protein [Burkholderiaceae bacterium]